MEVDLVDDIGDRVDEHQVLEGPDEATELS
jgi:hypothetical protein